VAERILSVQKRKKRELELRNKQFKPNVRNSKFAKEAGKSWTIFRIANC
jgi:hypothetical protein